MSISDNLSTIRNQIADACARAHRSPSDVALMAVSKTHPAEAILQAHAAGQHLFGENRVQEWQDKLSALQHLFAAPANSPQATRSDSPSAQDSAQDQSDSQQDQCHLIGPLQSNKSARAAELFAAIDTIDSLKLARRLNASALGLHKILPVLIEVKLSPEPEKHGLHPNELPALLAMVSSFTHLSVDGLMTVPPFFDNPEDARPFFARLREIRDENQPLCPTLTQLSMGMSNDFAVAIEEGSTSIRIGTAIFGKRETPMAPSSDSG